MLPPRETGQGLVSIVFASMPALLLFWWWVRGVRSGSFEFPYFRVDRRRRRIEFWVWTVVGLLGWLALAAIPVVLAFAAPRVVLA